VTNTGVELKRNDFLGLWIAIGESKQAGSIRALRSRTVSGEWWIDWASGGNRWRL
jgi:hypothetical protein